VYAIEYIINDVFSSRPHDTTTERIDLLRELQPYINNADQIEKKLAIYEIASRLQMDVVFVEDFFKSNDTVTKYQLYSIDGERTVLAECIRNTEFLINIMDTVKPDDFYLSKHRALYQLLADMVNNKNVDINIETVIGQANNTGIAAYFENGEYIKGLENIPNGAIDFHVSDIKDKSVRRRVDSYTDQLKGSLNDLHVDTSQAIETFNSKVIDVVVSKSDDKVIRADKQVDGAMAIVMDRMRNPNKMVGYDIGQRLGALSQQLRGLQRKRIHTIAANQGVGKSKLLANMMMGTTVEPEEKVPALWFSYEMDEDEITLRNLAILSGISQDAIYNGTLTMDEHDILQQWALVLRQSPLFLTTKCRAIEEALALARKHILYDGVKIIAFDYIQLMTAEIRNGMKRNEMYGIITKKLKDFVMDMDVAAVLVAQLGKQGVTKDIATAEDVYFGYEIAQDSDVFAVIQRKSQEQIEQMGLQKGNLLINLDKNRGRKDDQLYNVYAHDTNCRLTIV
jgi:replicative DNA helicase